MQYTLAALGLVAVVMAAPQPEVARAVKARQVGGGLGGFIPHASGFASGTVPASGLPYGCIGGAIDNEGFTICARSAPKQTPAPVVERQEGGGVGGFVPSASGFVSGTVPASGIPYGCIGGGVLGPQGITICARDAEVTPAPEAKRQIGGGLGGFVPGAEGTITGDVPAKGEPTGFLSGSALGESATLAGRQIGGGLGGFVPGAEGTATGDVPASGKPTGFLSGSALGHQGTLAGRAAEPTPVN